MEDGFKKFKKETSILNRSTMIFEKWGGYLRGTGS
jgi:hypothetical protein